jgi:hypothetical protein
MDSEDGFDRREACECLERIVGDFDREADAAEFVRLALIEKPGLRAWKFNREELYYEES